MSTVKDAIFIKGDRPWLIEPIEKHPALIIKTVTIGILMDGNSTDRIRLALSFGIQHVSAHFHHPHPAIAIETQSQRTLDRWLVNHRADLEFLVKLERFESIIGTESR